MKTYDLYGTSALTPGQLVAVVTPLLGLEFEERDSGYRGGYYRAGHLREEHIVILGNDRQDEDELPEPDFADTPVLLEVNATRRPDDLRRLLAQVPELSLLRSKEL